MISRIRSAIPIISWLPAYQRSHLTGDLIAGLTVGVMLVPQGMAYAMIAGLPPIYGLYAALVPIVMYAIFGTSRQLAVGPVAMVSLLVATGLGAFPDLSPADYILLAMTLAMMVGVIQFLLGAFRLGFLVNFLSHPVISGFTSAAAIIIGVSQLKHLLGISLAGNAKVHQQLWEAFQRIGEVKWQALFIGLAGMAIIMGIRRINKRIPGPLLAVVFGIVMVLLTGWDAQGLAIVGEVPGGLPVFRLPSMDPGTWASLLPTALTIAMVSFMESISVAKAIQNRHRGEYEIVPNQELIALGMANFGGSFFQAFPVDGGFSRSAVNDQAGAKTGMASLISAALVALTLLFLTPLFHDLPQAILASIIMVAVLGLVDWKEAVTLWKRDRQDFYMLIVTFVATLAFGIIQGILVGVLLSLVLVIYQSAYPHIAVLGKIPGTPYFRNVSRFKEAQTTEGVLVLRFDAPLYFANATYFRDRIRKLEAESKSPLTLLIINAESISGVDSSAARMLRQLVEEGREKGRDFAMAGAIGPVRDQLQAHGLTDLIGKDHLFPHVQDAIDALCDVCEKSDEIQRLAWQVGEE